MIIIKELRMNYQKQLMAVKELPQFSWIIESDKKNIVQQSYQLQLASDITFENIIYDSGEVKESQSVNISVPFINIKAPDRIYARVKVSTNAGNTDFCEPVDFIVGILSDDQWKAEFITAEKDEDADKSNATYLRREFKAASEISEAFVFSTALGLYKLYINGKRVGDAELAPGWTSYNKHLLYQTYEVTDLLKAEDNAIGAMVGVGWYKGKMGFVGQRNHYGNKTALLLQLLIRYKDGTEEVIISDNTWRADKAPVVFADIYDGETYDAALEQVGWNETGFDDSNWQHVNVVRHDKTSLTVQQASYVKEMEELPVISLFKTPEGETCLDFGQNLSGWIKFKARGKKGDKVELNCFETLDSKGNVYLDNLRGAKQTITYIFGKDGEIEFSPSFTFMGFRYARISSWPGEPAPENFVVKAVYSDMEQTGWFNCSNSDLNQLNKNVNWSLKGNFVDVPTDCPQRNERLGWTGDAQIFARTACYLMNTYEFFSKWLVDVAADQTPEGGVPHVVPDILSGKAEDDWLLSQGTHSAAAWADVAVIMPWAMYLNYGDKKIIHKQYDSMKGWIDFMQANSNDYIWNYKLQFGDWVALDAEEGSYFGATPNDLTCTAYFAYSTGLFAKMARIAGKSEDADKYDDLYKRVVDKYQRTFFMADGTMTVQTQTAHIISLYFGLVPDKFKQQVTDGLIKLLEKEQGHLVTGFVGTPYFCHALSQNGKTKEAFELLLRDDFPSWLYQVKMGATTIWEHWDGLRPDGTMWSADMNSFNHYAYGAVDEWIYRVLGGLDTDENNPGFKHSIVYPRIGGNLDFAETSYLSPYGNISTRWEVCDKQKISLKVAIPHNTKSTIILDNASKVISSDGLDFAINKDGLLQATAGSGDWKVEFMLKD